VLRIRSCNSIESAQFTHPIGRIDSRDAFETSIAVSGIGRIQLIGTADPTKVLILTDRIVDGKGIVSRNPKDVRNAELGKP